MTFFMYDNTIDEMGVWGAVPQHNFYISVEGERSLPILKSL